MTSKNINLLTSVKRTLVPIIVGVLGASFLGGYIDSATMSTFLSGLISSLYYVVLRFIETKWPEAGILLGARYQPVYTLVTDSEE